MNATRTTRRQCWAPLTTAAAVCMRALQAKAAGPRVLILLSAQGEAYGAALAGLSGCLRANGTEADVVDVSAAGANQLLQERWGRSRPDIVVAVGTLALTTAKALPAEIPLIATMVFRSEALADTPSGPRSRRASLPLDVPLASLLGELKAVLPAKRHAGMIRNPQRGGPSAAALNAEAKQSGFALELRDCDRTEDLLRVFLSLRGAADFVWCPPESSLFNSSTIKPLILASLRSGLPIVGFSENFVRAGAALGVYPDYVDVGRQTGELVRQTLDGAPERIATVSPRIWRVALNGRVARMLGLRYAEPSGRGEDRFLVLQ